MERILNILKSDPSDINLEELKEEVEGYYHNNGRHSYAKISAFIYSCDKGDIEYITENLDNLYKIMIKDKSHYASNVSKLIDHIELEDQRESHIQDIYMDSIQKKMSLQRKINKAELARQRSDLHEELKSAKESLEIEYISQRQKIEALNNNIVSVLGIFGAIIVAFFGGLSFLGGVLDNMHNVSAYRLSFIGSLYLIGLFDVIFLLFYCISKIVDKPIWSLSATKSKCADCKKSNNFGCLIKKYTLVVYFNIGLLVILMNIVFLYMLDKFNILAQLVENFKFDSSKGLNIATCGIIIYLINISLIVLIFWIYKKIKLDFFKCFKCSCDFEQDRNQEQGANNGTSDITLQTAAATLQYDDTEE